MESYTDISDVYRHEGYRGLFKGLGPNLIGVVPARAINFFVYGNGKRIISDKFNDGIEAAWVHLTAAAVAGIATSTFTNPIWLIKTRLQLDRERNHPISRRRYRNSVDCLKQVLRDEGVSGLYKGLSASYLGVSESALQWVLYERIKSFFRKRRELKYVNAGDGGRYDQIGQWAGTLTAAGAAKLFAAILTYPHEVWCSSFKI